MEVVKTRGWTKWGGGRLMLIKSNPDTWCCQSCGEEQTKESPAYMFPLCEENYIKICSECENKVVRIKIVSFSVLKQQNLRGMWLDNREY
jgi:Zn finger protein HypA/HybF involved in hydrogenase expression